MEVNPTENGIVVIPNTEFEAKYMCMLFTLSHRRKVVFNHDTGILVVTIIKENQNETNQTEC